MISVPQGKVAKQNLEQHIRGLYLDGNINPLQVEVGIKGIEDAIKAVRKDTEVRDTVLAEVSKYAEKTIDLKGAKVTKKNIGKYDFEVCGDPVYEDLVDRLNELKAEVKKREDFLKALPEKTSVVDNRTGEVCEIYPAVKLEQETIAIRFV